MLAAKKRHVNKLLIIILVTSGILSVFVLILQAIVDSLIRRETDTNTVTFYYHKIDKGTLNCDRLSPLSKPVEPNDKNPQYVVQQVVSGLNSVERESNFISFFSNQTTGSVRSIRQENKTIYIDLYDLRQIEQNLNNELKQCGPSKYLLPIEKTLTANFDIKSVKYAINGSPQAYAEWSNQWCGPFEINCPQEKFTDNGQTGQGTTRVSSLSGNISLNSESWFIQQDSSLQTEYDDNTIITKTLITNQNSESSEGDFPDSAVKLLIVEKNGMQPMSFDCSQTDTICEDTSIGGTVGKVKRTTIEGKVREDIIITKDNKTYIIHLVLPFNNTANKEYEISRKIIESITINT